MNDFECVPVGLGTRAYEVRIGAGLIGAAAAHVAPLLARPRVAIIADEGAAAHHLAPLVASFAASGIEAPALELPAGEPTKSWQGLERACAWLLDQKVERRDMVVALGGGVTGDLAGFAAAILRRGVRFVQVPTTLLAQVDSSVGGKTGINTAHGKNLIGAFHQPSLVLADSAALDTLPARDLGAGYGEVLKYGLLGDAEFFTWLEGGGGAALLRGDADARRKAVRRSVEMKAGIVARDERETGERALLNLGHTFCHALEAATGYSARLLHGEGVAIGCVLAFALSARMGLCAQEAPGRVAAHLRALGLKATLADIPGPLPDAEALLELMAQDKKVEGGKLRLILAHEIGAAFQTDDAPRAPLLALLNEALAERRR